MGGGQRQAQRVVLVLLPGPPGPSAWERLKDGEPEV
jgi:hypothetical protein